MSTTSQIGGAVLFLAALAFILFVRKAKTPDPVEEENEEEFDEKVIYFEDYVPIWRKKKEAK